MRWRVVLAVGRQQAAQRGRGVMGMFYADMPRYEMREFWERGKPKQRAVAPRFSYAITRLYNDLWMRTREIVRPFDHTFLLRDKDVAVNVRVVWSEAVGSESWSINGGQFIFNDCTGRQWEILRALEDALLRGTPIDAVDDNSTQRGKGAQ